MGANGPQAVRLRHLVAHKVADTANQTVGFRIRCRRPLSGLPSVRLLDVR